MNSLRAGIRGKPRAGIMKIGEMKMDIMGKIKEILSEILDIENREMTAETYVVRDLDAESIDLLELAVALNAAFDVDINDDEIYLRRFRLHLMEAKQEGRDAAAYLSGKFAFLSRSRVEEIIGDLPGGPTLKIGDLVSYISWRSDRTS